MKSASIVLSILLGSTTVRAAENEKALAAEGAAKAPALAAAMKGAKISLARGLKASEKEGKAISAKFEMEDGKLQLSVYTAKGDQFFEVVVDHKTGKVVKTEPITSGEDLAAAKKQAEAMASTKRSLRDVVAKAEKANPGYKTVSVAAEVENGASQADVMLLKGTESKQVEEKL